MGSKFCHVEDVQEFVHCLVPILIATEPRGVDSPTGGFDWLLLMYSLMKSSSVDSWQLGLQRIPRKKLSLLGPSRISALLDPFSVVKSSPILEELSQMFGLWDDVC